MHPTARLEACETLREILAVATPRQRQIIILRGLGWTDREIAADLGIGRSSVSMTMTFCRRRIAEHLPHLAETVADRSRCRGDKRCRGRRVSD